MEALKEKDSVGGTFISAITRTEGGRWFYLKREQGQSQAKLVWRDSLTGDERLLIDPDVVTKEKGRPHAIQSFHPSPDGKWLAYGMHASGSEIGNMYVIEVATGKLLLPPLTAFDLRAQVGEKMDRVCFSLVFDLALSR